MAVQRSCGRHRGSHAPWAHGARVEKECDPAPIVRCVVRLRQRLNVSSICQNTMQSRRGRHVSIMCPARIRYHRHRALILAATPPRGSIHIKDAWFLAPRSRAAAIGASCRAREQEHVAHAPRRVANSRSAHHAPRRGRFAVAQLGQVHAHRLGGGQPAQRAAAGGGQAARTAVRGDGAQIARTRAVPIATSTREREEIPRRCVDSARPLVDSARPLGAL